MNTPVIGICAVFERARWGFWNQTAALVAGTYLGKVRDAGGVSLVLPPDPEVVRDPSIMTARIDGLLLIGGLDLDPASYGAEREAVCEAVLPERDDFEIAMARAALEQDIPVLGICRGMQILNVATGGTLHQDLGAAGFAEHRAAPGRLDHATEHEVEVEAGSQAARMTGAGVQTVNSHHHQGVDRLGLGAHVTARSVADGLPEALEWIDRRYALGVQWHPESDHLDHAFYDFVRAADLENA